MKISPDRLAQLAPLFESTLQAARIPGAALAIVSGTETIYARGFGVRDHRRKLPVTADTFYPIASTTKAMTATLLALLVEEGKLAWDAPVQRYLPRFRLHDVTVSHRLTLRDLVAMRTGVPRHDWVWVGNTNSARADLVDAFAHLSPSADFRDIFQYNNLTVTLAGHLAEVVTGQPWEKLVTDRLLRPLGMRRATCNDPSGNATAAWFENPRRQLLPTQRLPADLTAPSGGSIHSTVREMTRWLAFNLNRGRVGPRRLLPAKSLAALHDPVVVVGNRSATGMPPETTYGLGWATHFPRGHHRVSHGGYIHDVNSSVMFFPGHQLGLVCYINFGPCGLAEWLAQSAFETLLGFEPEPTLEEKLRLYEKRITDTKKKLQKVKRHANTRPTLPLAAHVGRYRHPAYGDIRIARRGARLQLSHHSLRLPLTHWHFDTWISEELDRWTIHAVHPYDRTMPLQFHLNRTGEIEALSVPFETEVPPIRFTKST